MAGVNKAILVGNLGKDPEIRYTPAGLAVANFSLATSEKVGQDREEKTEWHNIVAFGRLAEICGEYLAKGKQVYIEGRIQTREWQDRDGNKRRTTEIVANQMVMLGRVDSSEYRAQPKQQPQSQQQPQQQQPQQQQPQRQQQPAQQQRRPQSGGGRQYDQNRAPAGGGGGGGGQREENPPDYDDYGPPPGDDEIPF